MKSNRKNKNRNYMIMRNDETSVYEVMFCVNGDDTRLVNIVCEAQVRGLLVKICSDFLDDVELIEAEKNLVNQGLKKGKVLNR